LAAIVPTAASATDPQSCDAGSVKKGCRGARRSLPGDREGERRIAVGGMATVYRAVDTRLDRVLKKTNTKKREESSKKNKKEKKS